jgi:thiosulfate reductase cytochrome b subunit
MAERIYVFKRFERFWHWSQAGLIIFLMLTAFDIHGTYTIFGFEKAVAYHTIAAWSLIGLWVFAIFWHFTTGEWKQYIPTTEKVMAMANYYLFGIFKNAPHPFKLTQLRKHNPAAAPGLSGDHAVRRAADLGHRLPLPVLSGLGRLGPDRPATGMGRHRAYYRRLHDAGLPDRARLPDHRRPYAHRPHQGHDHRL